MGVSGARLRYRQFNGTFRAFQGMNNSDHPAIIPDNILQDAENVVIGPYGSIRKRPGFIPVGQMPAGTASNAAFRIMGQFTKSDGTNQIIAFSRTTNQIYYSTDFGATYTVAGAVTNPVMGAQYLDIFYIVSQANGIYKWTGSALSAVAGSPSGFWISVFKDRLWVCGTDSQLFYSSVAPAQETWPGANVLKISGGDGDRLVAALPFADHIVCFKTRSIWNLYLAPDPSAWQVRVFVQGHGCLSPYAVKVLNGIIYFIDYVGVFRTDGSSNPSLLSDPIRTIFWQRPLDIPVFYFQDSLSFFGKFCFCSIQIQGPPLDPVYQYYVFNLASGGWTHWLWQDSWYNTFIPTEIFEAIPNAASGKQIQRLVSQFQSPETNAGAPLLYQLSDPNSNSPRTDGQVQKSIYSSIRTRRTDFNFPYRIKRNKVSYLEIATHNPRFPPDNATPPGNIQLTYYTENSESAGFAFWPPLVKMQGTEAGYKVPGAGYFREMSVSLFEGTNAFWEVQQINIPFTIKADQSEAIQ